METTIEVVSEKYIQMYKPHNTWIPGLYNTSTGFTLPNGAMRSPDASWIELERWNALTDAQKASSIH